MWHYAHLDVQVLPATFVVAVATLVVVAATLVAGIIAVVGVVTPFIVTGAEAAVIVFSVLSY